VLKDSFSTNNLKQYNPNQQCSGIFVKGDNFGVVTPPPTPVPTLSPLQPTRMPFTIPIQQPSHPSPTIFSNSGVSSPGSSTGLPPGDCFGETAAINEQIVQEYDNSGLTEKVLKEGTLYYQFVNNAQKNANFRQACFNQKGMYKEIDYTATCTTSDGKATIMAVSGHPTCFAYLACRTVDPNDLLNEFTMKETEKRNSESRNVTLSCTGKVHDTKQGSFCMFMTENMVTNNVGLSQARDGLNPSAGGSLFGKSIKIKGDAAAYESACTTAGGQYSEVNLKVECTNLDNGKSAKYSAKNFPICAASTCQENELGGQFVARLLGNMDPSAPSQWTCSSGVMLGLSIGMMLLSLSATVFNML
jgi:hypothetical protein